MYSIPEFCAMRMSLCPAQNRLPVPPDDPDDVPALRNYLARVAGTPVIRDVIDVSSSALAADVEKFASGAALKPAQLRRVAFATARYLSRMTHRATPFGLLAGVGGARFGERATVAADPVFRKHVRADMDWLIEVVRPLETDPAVLPSLRLTVSDLCFRRDDRLVVPEMTPPEEGRRHGSQEVSIRYTAAVHSIVSACTRSPMRYTELAGRLLAEFPEADAEIVATVIGQLVDRGFLLTDLRPPLTVADPLRHVLTVLDRCPHTPRRTELSQISEALREYERAPVGAGGTPWRGATKAMRRLHAGSRSLVQVDLAFDTEIVLPRTVATELEQAAGFAWRVTPEDAAPLDVLAEYRSAFVERYGSGSVVPVKELVDPDVGLGAPAGYRVPLSPRRPTTRVSEPSERDLALLTLAQQATASGRREIVVDEELALRLARKDAHPAGYLEVSAEVFAESTAHLDQGDFRLILGENNFTRPGAFFGRFLHMLPELAETIAECAADVTGSGSGQESPGHHQDREQHGSPVQLVAQPVRYRWSNLIQVPSLTRRTIQVGLFADRSDPGVDGLDELAVGATHDRMYVLSLRTGEEVVPLPFHALNPVHSLPNAVRLLEEIGLSRTPLWIPWSWGLAERLPFLPGVRYGRTILRPARWRLGQELTDPAVSWDEWRRRWDRWRSGWELPETICAANRDHRLPLTLSSESSLRQLRALLAKDHGTVLQEDPASGRREESWTGGRAVEVAVMLRPEQTRRTPPIPRPYAVATRSTQPAHHPGGEWLYAKLFCAAARHDELLTRHVPFLLDEVSGHCDRWFFIRYEEEGSHLRLRFHGDPTALSARLLPTLHEWASTLTRAGLASRLVLDTYRPEYGRYGGPALMERAELAFHADAVSAIEQLLLREDGEVDLPMELQAGANVLDLAEQLDPGQWRTWLLERYPKGPHHRAFQQCRRQALEVLSPESDWAALRGIPGGASLLESWKKRAPAVAAYGRELRRRVEDGELDGSIRMFTAVLHMHCNRLIGIDRESEASAYAIARGVVQARLDRERARAR